MTTVKSLSREMKFFLLALIPIYFISVGLIIQPFDSIVTGIYEIIWEPDFLITDYIAVGGMGAAFVNAGMMALISIYFVYSLGMEMDGHTIRIYDKDRVICDCLRYRNKMDKEIFNQAIQHYIQDPAKSIPKLMAYAGPLRVKKIAKALIGVWL